MGPELSPRRSVVRTASCEKILLAKILWIKVCWYILLCIVFSPFYIFDEWKSINETADMFSLLMLDFKLLPPCGQNPHLRNQHKGHGRKYLGKELFRGDIVIMLHW